MWHIPFKSVIKLKQIYCFTATRTYIPYFQNIRNELETINHTYTVKHLLIYIQWKEEWARCHWTVKHGATTRNQYTCIKEYTHSVNIYFSYRMSRWELVFYTWINVFSKHLDFVVKSLSSTLLKEYGVSLSFQRRTAIKRRNFYDIATVLYNFEVLDIHYQ